MNKLSKGILIIITVLIIIAGLITYFYINKERKDKSNADNIPKREEVYTINNNDFAFYKERENSEYSGMKLLEYDNSNDDYAEIYYILYDYTTDPAFYYTLEITDELGNSILMDGKKEEQLGLGMIWDVKIKKVNLDSKINFSIFEKSIEENNIYNSASTQIDLQNDLEKKVKIDQSSNLKNATLGDINFTYIDDENVYFGKSTHAYSENLVGKNYSLPIKAQYGNRLMLGDYIDFSYEKNVNNLSLEDAFENLVLINKTFGQYGLSDFYGMDIINEQGEILDTVIINFEEMIKLCNGLKIEKDGKEYTKDSFDKSSEIATIKDKDVIIGNGIKAIKYYYDFDENYEHYIFIYKDNIYYICTPLNERIQDEVKQFLGSLQINN